MKSVDAVKARTTKKRERERKGAKGGMYFSIESSSCGGVDRPVGERRRAMVKNQKRFFGAGIEMERPHAALTRH